MKKKFVLIGVVGLVIGLFVYDIFVSSPWGRESIPIISTGSFMLVIYGFIAKNKSKRVNVAPLSPPPQASNAPACRSCGGPLEFIEQYSRGYCKSCQQYA